jgi:hypothetical protein
MLKKPFTKKSSGVAQSVGPEFKPQYCQKKKKKKLFLLYFGFSRRGILGFILHTK